MTSSPLYTSLTEFLTTNLGEQYGRIGDLIRDELGIDTLKQAQTSLNESDLVKVRATNCISLSSLRSETSSS